MEPWWAEETYVMTYIKLFTFLLLFSHLTSNSISMQHVNFLSVICNLHAYKCHTSSRVSPHWLAVCPGEKSDPSWWQQSPHRPCIPAESDPHSPPSTQTQPGFTETFTRVSVWLGDWVLRLNVNIGLYCLTSRGIFKMGCVRDLDLQLTTLQPWGANFKVDIISAPRPSLEVEIHWSTSQKSDLVVFCSKHAISKWLFFVCLLYCLD